MKVEKAVDKSLVIMSRHAIVLLILFASIVTQEQFKALQDSIN